MVEVVDKRPKISIIMPVYNSAEYLHLAVESVKRQTLKDWELLLIDDGSSDESGDLCDQYALQDTRIRVFHQENRGITFTRNRGIRESAAEYITFIDNDDEYVSDILEKTYSLAREYDADIVKFGYRVEEDYGNGIKEIRDNCADRLIVLEKENLADEYQRVRNSGYFNMIWNGIYRRKLFENKMLLFDESVIMGYEDWIFNNNIFLVPKVQVVLNYIGYIHYQRYSHSTSKKFHPNQIEADVKAANAEYELQKKLNELYGVDIKWLPRAADYLIDILSIFERKGCDYSIRKKKEVLIWVHSRPIFSVLDDGSKREELPVQRKMLVSLFTGNKYALLLLCSRVYFKYIMWKRKRTKSRKKENTGE